jgi:IS30 family transposase
MRPSRSPASSGLPEGTVPTCTQDDFEAIVLELNERPRQTLGFRTPSQAFAEVLR